MVTKILALGILAALFGMLAIACGTSQAAENTPAQSAASASAKSIQIERPATTFKGRSTPSAAFPFSDEEYIAAGKQILAERSDIPTVMAFWHSFDYPSSLKITPLYIQEYQGSMQIIYRVETPGGKKSASTSISFQPGTTLVAKEVGGFPLRNP